MESSDLQLLSNKDIPESIRSKIAEQILGASEREAQRALEAEQLASENKKFFWNTPFVAALAGLVTLTATFVFDRITASVEATNTITLEQVRTELQESEARLKQELEIASSENLAKLEAEAREREFQYEIVRAELEKGGKTNAERAEVLLFLARAGVFTALNAKELALMAQEQKDNPELTIIPQLSSALNESGSFNSRNVFRRSDLTYSFLEDPSDEMRNAVERATDEWASHGNISFRYVEAAEEAVIRILPSPNQSSSMIGRTALGIGADRPTMWLRNQAVNLEEQYSDILHQFGHAIGMVHEHQNPNADIKWDVSKVYDYFQSTYGWTRAHIDRNLLRKSDAYPCLRDFDPQSIMMYSIPSEVLFDGNGFERGDSLSETDKSCVKEMYPNLAR
ncbi:M12 family metallopeptidase [uncultured Roseobacter sp.]|uniref:M12 family metallopeptidase n=1 Tax=uncultured Roseobacter sp. TaxID=114847 RepID=UPI002601C810|nr:M12 family metallopeptidase [uncultured Roseobacter sp.]